MSVYIVKENNSIDDAIRDIFHTFYENIDFQKGFFLKPNIVFPVSDKTGQISRRVVVRSVIKVIREINPKSNIMIGEGTAAGSDPEKNFKISGYRRLAAEHKVHLVNLDKVDRINKDWKYGVIAFPKILFENNYINLPILKESSAAVISGAMKNQKGILLPDMKKRFHKMGLHEPIAYLNKVISPDLTILDGYNFFKKEKFFFAGDNCYEIDSIIASLLVRDIPDYLRVSKEIGLGNDTIKTSGIDITNIQPDYTIQCRNFKKLFRFRLWSNPQACSMCRFVLKDSVKFSSTNIKYSIVMIMRLLKYTLTGADVVYGSDPDFVYKNKKVICIGDCTRNFAKKNHYTYIPGCPPKKLDMIKYF